MTLARDHIEHIVTELVSPERLLIGCTHVIIDGADPLMCWSHPEAGLLCGNCLLEHGERASHEICPICKSRPVRRSGDAIPMSSDTLGTLTVSTPDGLTALLRPSVLMICPVFACQECADEANEAGPITVHIT